MYKSRRSRIGWFGAGQCDFYFESAWLRVLLINVKVVLCRISRYLTNAVKEIIYKFLGPWTSALYIMWQLLSASGSIDNSASTVPLKDASICGAPQMQLSAALRHRIFSSNLTDVKVRDGGVYRTFRLGSFTSQNFRLTYSI